MLPSLVAGQPDGDEQALAAQQLHAEAEAGHLRREHEAGVDAAELSLHDLDRLVGADREVGAERADELEPLLADVDADHLVAERGGDLHRVVAEPAGGADDRDRAARAARGA